MGDDGAKRVVVNSVGREIRTLEEMPPVEGRRVQLTIDSTCSGGRGRLPARRLQRRRAHHGSAQRRGAHLRQPAGLRPERLRGRHRPRHLGVAQHRQAAAAAEPRDPGPLLAGLDVQDRGGRRRRSRKGVVTPDYRINCTGGANFFGRYFKCHLKGGHGTRRPAPRASRSRATSTSTRSATCSASTRSTSGRRSSGWSARPASTCRTSRRASCRRTEWKRQRTGEKWYPGETISVSIGQGQVSVTPASLAMMIATVANGGTRVTPHLVRAVDEGQGWKPVPPPAVADAIAFKPETLWRRCTTGCGWSSTPRAPAAARRIAGRDVAGKTGTAQVISNQGRQAARGGTDRDLRDHGWFVFFAPRDNPRDRRRHLRRARRARLSRRADRQARHRDVLRQEGRPAAAGAAAAGRRRPAPSRIPIRRRRCRRWPSPTRAAPRHRDGRAVTGDEIRLMFERRLYYHIDWAMLVARDGAVR